MLGERAKALSAWLKGRRPSMGELKGPGDICDIARSLSGIGIAVQSRDVGRWQTTVTAQVHM